MIAQLPPNSETKFRCCLKKSTFISWLYMQYYLIPSQKPWHHQYFC
jgi:hypothetical protein